MTQRIELADEYNEIGWWSNWAKLFRPTTGAIGLYSREFPEPLFNHVVFLKPPPLPGQALLEAIEKFRARRVPPSFFVQKLQRFKKLRTSLSLLGFRPKDELVVLELRRPKFERGQGIICRQVGEGQLELWSRTYLRAFYGDEFLLPQVLSSVKRATKRGRSKFFLATHKGSPSGTLATYRKNGYIGVYCVGTVPEKRGKGVASTLLSTAHEYVLKRKDAMILQTFRSDDVERFYYERGFKRAYAKEVLSNG
ncbi:MAG: GNAT family N-acetyltransferase [Thaumarchaeota archaeon]|nr:GNAT family N-acetyltransferase [Nitrososphaerota archaeon]